MGFGERLKELRDEHGLTQKQVAISVGVGLSALAMWETNPKRVPCYEVVKRVAELFGTTAAYLLDGEKSGQPQSQSEILRLDVTRFAGMYEKSLRDLHRFQDSMRRVMKTLNANETLQSFVKQYQKHFAELEKMVRILQMLDSNSDDTI